MDSVLSLSKLKTLEYRLFRKMREKLRNYVKGVSRMDAKGLKQKYRNESRQLVEDRDLPQSFSFYLTLFDTAADVITGAHGNKD